MDGALPLSLIRLMGDCRGKTARMAHCLAHVPALKQALVLNRVICRLWNDVLWRWGVLLRELQAEGARTLAEPHEKPGGTGTLGMASAMSHRVQKSRLLTHSLTHALSGRCCNRE